MASPLLIFDCDGVLVDSESINSSEFHAMALEQGINIPYEDMHNEMLGGALYKVIELLEKKHQKKLPTDFIDQFRKRTFIRFKEELQPIDGVLHSLEKITLEKCIASNGPVEKMKLNLSLTNVIDHFNVDNIYSAYDINIWKPEPDLFLYAAKEMNIDPSKCIVIEDSANGVLAAKNANMKVIAFATPQKRDMIHQLQPDVLLEDMHDLHDAINQLTTQL